MHPVPSPLLPGWLFWPLLLLLVLAGTAQAQPRLLSQTGLDSAQVIAFTPAHPLWSDGTAKRRWIHVPAGRFIDAGDPDAWVFPRGTRLWKEFAYGQRVETRYLERQSDGRWLFATYVWRADGSDAELAPAGGIAALAVADAPGARYAIPSHDDCRACHGGARSTVLGFAALQLTDAVPALMARGLIRNAPPQWREVPPRVAGDSDAEWDARGHLHGNCGHCHHESGVPVPLVLAQRTRGAPAALSAGQLANALRRMGTRSPYTQMPPLGTRVVDERGLALVQAWADRSAGAGLKEQIAHHLTSNVTSKEN